VSAGAIFWATMLVKVACPCGHVGVVDASTLPRELQCSRCGAGRHVEPDSGRAIVSTARFEEWLAGERPRPQARPATLRAPAR
jgi:hypothetical protein